MTNKVHEIQRLAREVIDTITRADVYDNNNSNVPTGFTLMTYVPCKDSCNSNACAGCDRDVHNCDDEKMASVTAALDMDIPEDGHSCAHPKVSALELELDLPDLETPVQMRFENCEDDTERFVPLMPDVMNKIKLTLADYIARFYDYVESHNIPLSEVLVRYFHVTIPTMQVQVNTVENNIDYFRLSRLYRAMEPEPDGVCGGGRGRTRRNSV